MFRNIFLSLALIFSVAVFADGHTGAEKTVLKNIEAYWEARNTSDWDKVVAMSSSSGMLNTNSDGSFHKPMATQTASDWERQSAGGTGVIQVHASEAHQLNDTTVYVRYYAEGVVAISICLEFLENSLNNLQNEFYLPKSQFESYFLNGFKDSSCDSPC